MNAKSYIALFFILVTIACEETITLDTRDLEPIVVIEGLVTDQNRRQFVRVSRTKDFYEKGDVSGVEDAAVTIADDQGNEYRFVYATNQQPGIDGYYFSETSFAGVVGRRYTLTVRVDGVDYIANDVMQPVGEIDSLKSHINRNQFEDPDEPGYFYEVRMYAREPQNRKDYYLFKFYRNDSIVLNMRNDIYIVDDEFLGEMINGVPLAGFYRKGDTARVEMFSLSRSTYIFYSDMMTLLTSDGGMFSPPPANPRNNISNGALGHFQTSAVSTESLVVN